MKYYSFQDWSVIYKNEIDHIVDQYTAFIMEKFSGDNKYHSLNLQLFSEKMRHLIYKTSVNKEKNNILYL